MSEMRQFLADLWKEITAPRTDAPVLGTGKPVKLVASIGPVTEQVTNLEIPPMQLIDTEQFTLSIEAEDSKGFAVADTLTWSVDNPAVVTVTPSADTMSAVIAAVAPGSAVVSLTDGTLSATEAVDVVPGGVAKLVVTEGPVTEQA